MLFKNAISLYAPNMRRNFRNALLVLTAAWILAACQTASRKASIPAPESEQVVREELKDLYMRVSTAVPHSQEQQKLILSMAREAANGKELLLVMRAAEGIFPAPVEAEVRSLVTTKMMDFATLDQLVDYAMGNPIDSGLARHYAERLLELGSQSSDAREWFRIKAAAHHLGAGDLEQQALAKAEQLGR